ncbi:MAG: hypothetical protein HY329_14905 [Chloroflexi bacterium]|nr:hypothetical protein [Chloroflexota bacterium]
MSRSARWIGLAVAGGAALAGVAVVVAPKLRDRLPPALTDELPELLTSSALLARDAAPLVFELAVFYLDRAQPAVGQMARTILHLTSREG